MQYPRWRRWEGGGQIAVQTQRGMPLADLCGAGRRLARITVVDTSRRRKIYAVLHLRVGSDAKKRPIWADFPMAMHRLPPPGARIRWVKVLARREGPVTRWYADFVLAVPTARSTVPGPAVAVDLGWRKMGPLLTSDPASAGIRVAYWRGEDGQAGEVVLGPDVSALLERARGLQAVRDRHLDTMRDWLVAWIAAQPALPEWYQTVTRYLAAWRSPARYVALLRRWQASRWEGDGEGLLGLRWWAYRDRHLWAWQTRERAKALGRRRELYRVLAAGMATRYATLVLEDFDLRTYARRPPIDADLEDPATPPDVVALRAQRAVAAPAELRTALEQAFTRRGKAVVYEAAAYTTIDHHDHEERFDAAREVWHTCRQCHAGYDQDANACDNLLARYRERGHGDGTPGGARDPKTPAGTGGSRYARRRAKAEARREEAASE